MSKFNKLVSSLILSLVVGLGLLTPPATASQRPIGMAGQARVHHHRVYWRYDCNSSWVLCPQVYRTRGDAQRFANWLEYTYSVETFIR